MRTFLLAWRAYVSGNKKQDGGKCEKNNDILFNFCLELC